MNQKNIRFVRFAWRGPNGGWWVGHRTIFETQSGFYPMGPSAYLLGSENQEAPRRDTPGVAGDRVLRVVRGQVPPLWLALFEPEDLRWGRDPGDMGRWRPYFSARREKCAAVYRRRRRWLRRVFRHHRKTVEAWESYIRFVDAPCLKLEFDQIVIDGFSDTRVMGACDIFDGAPEADLAPLMQFAGEWTYNGANGALVWRASNSQWVAGDADLMGCKKETRAWWPLRWRRQ